MLHVGDVANCMAVHSVCLVKRHFLSAFKKKESIIFLAYRPFFVVLLKWFF